MSEFTAEDNKEIVREAFDTLFNRTDYTAAERFWSVEYIQHSAHIPPGRDGLFNLIRSHPPALSHELELTSVSGLPMFGDSFPEDRRRTVVQGE